MPLAACGGCDHYTSVVCVCSFLYRCCLLLCGASLLAARARLTCSFLLCGCADYAFAIRICLFLYCCCSLHVGNSATAGCSGGENYAFAVCIYSFLYRCCSLRVGNSAASGCSGGSGLQILVNRKLIIGAATSPQASGHHVLAMLVVRGAQLIVTSTQASGNPILVL